MAPAGRLSPATDINVTMRACHFYGVCNVLENLLQKDIPAASSPIEAKPQPAMTTEETQAWQDRIHAAADDAALLQLAHEAPTVPLKLTTIEALTLEESFKQAMYDFREHDKRLYRAAKSRWETASGKRIAASEAQTLIAGARALLEQTVIPVNRVVELDQAWAAITVDMLEPALRDEFAGLSAQLGTRVREHGEHAQTVTRWLGATDPAMKALSETLPGVTQGSALPTAAEAPAVALLELVHATPDAGDIRCQEKAESAKRLLALASSVTERAKFLQTLPAPGESDEASERQMIEQWRAIPEMSEGELNSALSARFADWRNTGTAERQREHDTHSAEERAKRADQNKKRVAAIERDVAAAEAAQAEGHIADLTRLLNATDQLLKRGAVNAALTQRIEILRAEQRRLQDWQRWSGRQGREQLVTDAQALAAQVAGKISLKPHAEAIDKLRERWKELDKLGAASNQPMWQAFDGALEAAYVPVAAHLEKLKQARAENLAAREQIVAGLVEAVAKYFPVVVEGADPAAPDWRALGHALEDAKLAWRKLGPVEHTVPRKMLKGNQAITTRYAAAVQALEAPLKNAHADARGEREKLIASAKELAASDVLARDVVDKVPKLQTQWQTVAKSQPLPRRDENALWQAFKTATDAIFTGRDAARAAKDAEANALQKARMDIIEQVAALAHGASAADIKRALAEAETAWRAAPEAPRPQTAKLDARYRAARDAASKRISELAAVAARARYDALLEAIALCGEREATGAPADDMEARWNAIEHLQEAWKTRLENRFRGNADVKATAGLPDHLLNLEAACSVESPDEFQAARQRLKMLALKNAMEGRQTAATTPADIERWLLDAASSVRPDDTSRERLAKIIAAIQRRS